MMKNIFIVCLFLSISFSTFSQKNISFQLGVGRASSFSQMLNKNEVSMMKVWNKNSPTIDANIGYQITPKNTITLGLSLNDYSWEVKMKSPNNSFKNSEFEKHTGNNILSRRDGYSMLLNLKLKSQVFKTEKSNLNFSIGIGTYCTSCLAFTIGGKYVADNTNNQLTSSHDYQNSGKPFLYSYAGDNFKYFYYWNFAPTLSVEYGFFQKKNEVGIFAEGLFSLKKNYEFNVFYYANKDGKSTNVPPTETAKIVNRGIMLRTGLYYRFNNITEKTYENPLKTIVLPTLNKFAKTEQKHDSVRKTKLTIWYGKANHLASALQYQSSDVVNIKSKPLNQNQFAFGIEYSRRIIKKWSLGTGLRFVSANFEGQFYTNSGEFLAKYDEIYFSNIQIPLFINRNFYIFNQNILFHTDLGIVANLFTSGIGLGSDLSLKHNEESSNKDVFIKCAVSFPKYAKGLQIFVLYSGIANLNGKQHANIVNGSFIRYTGEPPAPRVREERYFTMYYKPTYISFGLAYDFNISKRQKKAIEFQ